MVEERAFGEAVHLVIRTVRLAEDKLSYPVGWIIILSEDSPDIG